MQTIPRLIRWIFTVAIFFFILMFLLRLATWFYFAPPGADNDGIIKSFWLGFRFDAREVGVVCLLLLIFGSMPALHPFTSKAGKTVTFSIIILFLIFFLVLYVFDFLHFRYLLQRLNASALSFLDDAKISGTMVWQTYPVIKILLGMIAAFVCLFWILRSRYKKTASIVYMAVKQKGLRWVSSFFLFVHWVFLEGWGSTRFAGAMLLIWATIFRPTWHSTRFSLSSVR